MTVYLLKKKKGRVYRSEQCLAALAEDLFPELPKLVHDASGAPVLPCCGGADKRFISISDTKNYWACVLSGDGPVGLDIEDARSVKASVAAKFHRNEQSCLGGLEEGSSEWTNEFLSIWTRKESYMKYCGEGLRLGLSSFSVIKDDMSFADRICAKDRPEGFIAGISSPPLFIALCTASPEDGIDVQLFSYDGEMPKPALEKASELLASKDHMVSELSGKLQRLGYSKPESDAAAEELRARGYMNDEDSAARYARRAADGGKGNARIRTELLRRGADAAAVEQALRQLAENGGESEAVRAARAVSGMRCGNEKELARIGRRLFSLGYQPKTIYDILGELKKNESDG